jgi:ketosteroid isomerase-like protein
MHFSRFGYVLSFLALIFFASHVSNATEDKDKIALQQTSIAIRQAFSSGDVDGVMKYHHRDVEKALSYHNVLIGRDAVAADLRNTLQHVRLEFTENHVESLLVEGNTAVEQTRFVIQVTQIGGGQPTLFKGRAMIVYVRDKGSPTGWASIREMIQPATE